MVWINSELTTQEVKKDWDFDVGDNVIKDGKCPCTTQKVKIVLSKKSLSQIKSLCRKYPQLEWMATLIGKQEDNYMLVDEIQIFEQEVSGSTCELTDKGNEDMAKTENIGWIHSHNTMDVFLSSTDVDTANFNGISLCVNNKLEFDGKIRKLLPCGVYALLDVELETEIDEDEEITSLADELISVRATNVVRTSVANNELNFCALCERKVSKKKSVEMNGCIVHKKCFNKYERQFDRGERTSGAVLSDQEYIDDYLTQCDDCEEIMANCQCYNHDRAMRADSLWSNIDVIYDGRRY
jgi:proteasome lid subunit RPN8/RPN11|tara:strand:- start:26 stop:913 length:888 start_codon:yes stop_codon:yes gene_type:complete